VKQVFFPNVPSFFIMVDVDFPDGSPYQYSIDLTEHMQTQARKLDTDESLLALNEGKPFIREVSATLSGNHINMFVGLIPAEQRVIGLDPVVARLKELIGPLPEAKSYSLTASLGSNAPAIELNLRMLSNQVDIQNQAVADVTKILSAYPEVNNVRSNLDTGRLEVELALKPYAETMGITMAEIATQVRQSFYGEEVQRIPRSKEDVKVMLRYPLEQRSSLDTLDQLRIRTQQGVEIPLESVADVTLVPGSSAIRRTDRQRNIKITADIVDGADSTQIITKMLEDYLPEWKKKYTGFNLSTDGNLKAQSQFGDNFLFNFGLALIFSLAIFAIAFKSLFEPLLVVLAVPFGFMGAILGHLILGIDISLFSFMGFLACSGVVVNDNLVLLERLNHLREKGASAFDAALNAGADRFRAIILTSLTTFMGLMPILFETSTQAQFLIPMVTSLAFGVAVSSLVTLILVPATYFAGYSFGRKIKMAWYKLVEKIMPTNKQDLVDLNSTES
jgi:multidrug efflux pump subunit AcrB